MGYLDICNIADIERKANAYFGKIIPKVYSQWRNFEPSTLFLEGVNQFCIKTINKFFKPLVTKERFVPCQLKNYHFYKNLTYETYFIKATFKKTYNIYIATFEAFENNSFNHQNLAVKGEVCLSAIETSILNTEFRST